MKDALTREVIQQMLPLMDNEQAMHLQSVLGKVLMKYKIIEIDNSMAVESTNEKMVTKFIEAKRIEGCSEKTLVYYRKTIDTMLDGVGKEVIHIMTEDLRNYLTSYQERKQLSRVTVDKIGRASCRERV